jgi:hypothetical protein
MRSDIIVMGRSGLRHMLLSLGWDRRKIRRYLAKMDRVQAQARRQHKRNPGIEPPQLFEVK